MKRYSALLALVFVVFAAPRIVHAECHLRSGDKIVLYGTTDDPDVFIWDSRFRLRDYAGGSFDEMNALLPHAVLARPGTRAVVESCVSNFVQSKYFTNTDDAIGVRILNGPLNGQRGWVLGSSTRGIRPR
ncbi:MAG: hypothetical protein JO322_13110 [Candidatus Eremiobacteraeota bacterium]|nr:hypothetical protein [Candidatus Eremiobacteraeota bacterium]